MRMLSTEQLLSLVNGLGAIVWEAEPETFRFTFVSEEAVRILGYPAQDWLDDPDFWVHHTHPDDVDRCATFCREATRRGEDHQFEYRMHAADGRIVWLRDIVSVRPTADGGRRLVGIALDITSEKQEQADKRRIAQLYESLIENSTDIISLIRPDGITVYQSQAVQPELGYDRAELTGRKNFDLVHPEDVDRIQDQFTQLFRSDVVLGPVRYRFRHKDGSWRFLESVAKRYDAPEGHTFAVVNTRDVSEVVKTQERLEATQEQLAQAMKMEAVGRLAGGVAHDFNNLLTVIAGYAELVSATLNTPDFRVEDLDEIKRAAHRASLLTRQLLAFGRKQVLRPEVLDINVVVREVGRLVSRLIGEDIELVLETTSAPLPVFGDRSQVEQVLMNLAVNARDAMPTGGRLIIRTEGNESTVFLIVMDTGIGMTPQLLENIFEPFFTTKEVGKGTGLGLSTAYGIVKQSKGDIKVQSDVNKGTVFTISLPRVCEPHPAEARGAAEKRPGGETILLVEDDERVRDLVEQALLRLGYDVLTAADGGGAIDLCQRYQGKISLLITDIVMAQASGPQVYAQVAALVPGVAVLYMSGYTGETILGRGGREEGVSYLQKPFTQATLARRVREVLDEALRPQTG
jgi:two-component system, cell cycle sensor histidine kinase and response regulator CckA